MPSDFCLQTIPVKLRKYFLFLRDLDFILVMRNRRLEFITLEDVYTKLFDTAISFVSHATKVHTPGIASLLDLQNIFKAFLMRLCVVLCQFT